MKVTGYVYESEIYCEDCAVKKFGEGPVYRNDPVNKFGQELGVVWSTSECDYDQTCDVCHTSIDCVNLTRRDVLACLGDIKDLIDEITEAIDQYEDEIDQTNGIGNADGFITGLDDLVNYTLRDLLITFGKVATN